MRGLDPGAAVTVESGAVVGERVGDGGVRKGVLPSAGCACYRQAIMNNKYEPEDSAKKMFDSLLEEAKRELMEMMDKAETEEDLIAFALIGPCPRCGNELTKDGESLAEDGDVGDPTVGVCPECNYRGELHCLPDWMQDVLTQPPNHPWG